MNSARLFETFSFIFKLKLLQLTVMQPIYKAEPHHFFVMSSAKVRKDDKYPQRPVLTSPAAHPHLRTHERTDQSTPPLMVETLFISPANLDFFFIPFRNRGTKGWEESEKSIKNVEEDGQRRSSRIKRGRGCGNEEGQEVCGHVQAECKRREVYGAYVIGALQWLF